MTSVEGTSLASAVDLLAAIEDGRLLLHYQGVFDVATGALRGAEALIRWDHAELGMLAPASFLPGDMSGGLGWALTNFVLEEALRQTAAWWRSGHRIGISVNIAPGRLADDVLPERIAALLAREDLPAQALTVEITEHRCNIDPEGIREALVALTRLGVRISLDDFGTGESSLIRLRHLHFDEIKIDRQFVSEVASDPADRNIVRFVTELAHGLGSRVVAEGVETEESLSALRGLGVDLAQGFLLHRAGAAGSSSVVP
ncbi:MAG TPA: EAL domain-containing protein [Acidimicrobiales bacterium]|nr:EAL domain-containing protein [Acidimicrobiales bacterium]